MHENQDGLVGYRRVIDQMVGATVCTLVREHGNGETEKRVRNQPPITSWVSAQRKSDTGVTGTSDRVDTHEDGAGGPAGVCEANHGDFKGEHGELR